MKSRRALLRACSTTRQAMLLACAAIATASASAQAAMVTYSAANTATAVTAIPTGNVGTIGYALFDTNDPGNGSGPTIYNGVANGGYATVTTNASDGFTNGLTSINASGTTYTTGVAYRWPVTGGAFYTLATVSLGTGTPGSFVLSVLMNNDYSSSPSNDDPYVELVSTGANANSATQAIAAPAGGASENDFYAFTVSSAAPGDTITILAEAPTGSGTTALIGGVAFGAVPEPCSMALAAAAGIGLLSRRRRSAMGQA